jgi:hypothetical protein
MNREFFIKRKRVAESFSATLGTTAIGTVSHCPKHPAFGMHGFFSFY